MHLNVIIWVKLIGHFSILKQESIIVIFTNVTFFFLNKDPTMQKEFLIQINNNLICILTQTHKQRLIKF
jgi:hypothetical protein